MQVIKGSYRRFSKSSREILCCFYFFCLYICYIIFFVSGNAYGQEVIVAKYKLTTDYNIDNTLERLYRFSSSDYTQFNYEINFKENKSVIRKTDSLLSDTLIRSLVNEELKMLLCSYSYYYYCNSQRNMLVIDSFDNSQKQLKFNVPNNFKNYILDYKSLFRIPLSKKNEDYKGEIVRVDSSKLEFVKTDSIKTIESWQCQKYISKDSLDNTTIWLTEDIPYYVNPQIFAINIKKAVVCVEYNNGYTLTLVCINRTNKKIPSFKDKTKANDNIQPINPLNIPIPVYHHP